MRFTGERNWKKMKEADEFYRLHEVGQDVANGTKKIVRIISQIFWLMIQTICVIGFPIAPAAVVGLVANYYIKATGATIQLSGFTINTWGPIAAMCYLMGFFVECFIILLHRHYTKPAIHKAVVNVEDHLETADKLVYNNYLAMSRKEREAKKLAKEEADRQAQLEAEAKKLAARQKRAATAARKKTNTLAIPEQRAAGYGFDSLPVLYGTASTPKTSFTQKQIDVAVANAPRYEDYRTREEYQYARSKYEHEHPECLERAKEFTGSVYSPENMVEPHFVYRRDKM